jgi:hypothetical protein
VLVEVMFFHLMGFQISFFLTALPVLATFIVVHFVSPVLFSVAGDSPFT